MKTAINFLKWVCMNTQYVQANARYYKDKYYFVDGENHPNRNDLQELYNAFIEDVT